eukprot:scaffold192568_cov49-Cyclotella_meneghiniana.AAC.1
MTTESATVKTILPPPTCAPFLLNANTAEKKLYWDRSHYDSPETQIRALARSSTVYVGNLAFSTRSIHLRRCFEMLGPVKSVHLGLHRENKTPCGFAFVEFHHRIDALSAVSNLTGTKLDGRLIRVELDAGFKPGRQFGRGASGGQVRDDRGGGSGRDHRRHSGEQNRNRSSSGGGDQQRLPRWEAPPSAKDNAASIYGPGGDIDAGVGEKRSRDEGMDEGDRATKNARYNGDDPDL